jgi:choloylglycine hydrolase
MCTALSISADNHYFGRNLDLPYHYEESVTITPRNYHITLRHRPAIHTHYAIIGIATVVNGFPLYYDGVNEYGVCMAALNFPGNAVYMQASEQDSAVASFELIPWVLAQHKTASEAVTALGKIKISNIAFSKEYPPTPLHWILADNDAAYTIEPTQEGLKIYKNHIRVLTNNPPFPWHEDHLRQYIRLTAQEPNNKHITDSNGSGMVGLPGDLTSAARFVRAAIIKEYAHWNNANDYNIIQFFHILQSVQQIEGCIRHDNMMDKTVYSTCCNATRGVYYYTTYENSHITAVSLRSENLNSQKLISYPLDRIPSIRLVN